MKNKITVPKGMSNEQLGNIDWIKSLLTKACDSTIRSVNTFFKDFDITYNYKIKIKLKEKQ
ncbi:hypothetical protein LCGC14_1045390 [marine sediment metagenome]|uniref:Uncharacterized protein n=1 Tax=marine sediment metagenome TaxID=412755 RepID=A0A0F9MUV5_9ZZZZ